MTGARTTDAAFMAQALRLAARGWGRTSPNPMVGAVAVRNGQIVGRGYHRRAGTPHAEVHALHEAGDQARGATVYVTLEPCCTHGRTPPCTAALIAAGVGRVVIGCTDPNPAHAGQGVDILRREGIETECGVLEEACRSLNEPFFTWIRHGRPLVILKLAATLDGRIATASGDSRWITGPRSRARVQRLRRLADAVMVGGETARTDDPGLLVRTPAAWPRQPQRFVWTSKALPPSLAMFRDGGPEPVAVKPTGRAEWREFLAGLGREQVTCLLLEGGGELAAAALAAHAVDRVEFFIAPKILGGRDSRPAVGGENPAALADALNLRDVEVERLGPDILVRGRCPHVHGID